MKDAIIYISDCMYINKYVKKYCSEYYNFLILQKNSFYYKDSAKATYDDIGFIDDISNIDSIKNIIDENPNVNVISKIITFDEFSIEVAAELREIYNVDGTDLKSSKYARDKFLMKELMVKNGIKTARYEKVNSFSEIKTAVKKVGTPFIIKPLSGAGTIDTYKIEDNEQLLELKNKMLKNFPYIIEEYIDGREYHLDSISYENNVDFVAISKYTEDSILKAITEQKAYGSVTFPQKYHDTCLLKSLIEVNEKVIKALAIKNAVYHAEYFVTDYGDIYFGEIAIRVGGGPRIKACIENTHGLDIYEAALLVNIGRRDFTVSHREVFTGRMNFNIPSKSGVINKISTPEQYQKQEGVIETLMLRKEGDVIPKYNSSAVRLGHIIIEDEKYYQLKLKLKNSLSQFVLETRSEV
ncbi:phosphoribosylglycinamide synthetase [Vallitalea longa]|uniref:Phosphoribosylglycinamide synthetase n=1 Tax=Vallitalea longa TaxID=2936439 RepID=A0A9W5YD90_9FIRM|nr:ATP-grasp domain-containing protein [Vallitalea longa]GKX29098.1 phosphoribosylglycinamide synthetase [Vallitalea longa]